MLVADAKFGEQEIAVMLAAALCQHQPHREISETRCCRVKRDEGFSAAFLRSGGPVVQ